jgi:glycosyltransferase involved in cell wall biosynthesis
MKCKLITVIPVFNGEKFIRQTLDSVARQTLRPDRLIVIDNCSTDDTERLVREFAPIRCEWQRNPSNLGLFGNCNRALEFTSQTEYLHILHADDLIAPNYYETLAATLDTCDGLGLAFCLDERIDENDQHLSVSGKVTGQVEDIAIDRYLGTKAEIGNQAFSGTLLKTHYQAAPCQFRMDMPILADMLFWPDWGRRCNRITKVHLPLSMYRWHGDNTTTSIVPGLQTLVLDEWVVMQTVEKFRSHPASWLRWAKLKGLFAVRSGIKAKRLREQGNFAYASEIVTAAKAISGSGLWFMAQVLVHARDLVVYGLLGRRKHPKNVYS